MVDEYQGRSSPWYCPACCSPSRIDTEPHLLSPEQLIIETQNLAEDYKDKHVCYKLIQDATINQQQHFYSIGVPTSSISWRKGRAAFQLCIATACGYGIEKNYRQALKVLENAVITGSSGLSFMLIKLTEFLGLELPEYLPHRKSLAQSCLFTFGIPSEAFNTLSRLDEHLAGTVLQARSEVYNGHTATL